MHSLIAAASRALAAGEALGALERVALRDDPPALPLRGIATAPLGEHPHARALLRRARGNSAGFCFSAASTKPRSCSRRSVAQARPLMTARCHPRSWLRSMLKPTN
ncbi:hypothetical protein RCH10_005014 [Variovorax sp. GrIS 2.14]